MNSIMGFRVYWSEDVKTWAFDDESTGLKKELFVGGVPQIINRLLSKKEMDLDKTKKDGFILTFSSEYFPKYDIILTWLKSEGGGNTYITVLIPDEIEHGWLCPALFKYFEKPPKYIFVKINEVNDE